jgi:hypothetical protein
MQNNSEEMKMKSKLMLMVIIAVIVLATVSCARDDTPVAGSDPLTEESVQTDDTVCIFRDGVPQYTVVVPENIPQWLKKATAEAASLWSGSVPYDSRLETVTEDYKEFLDKKDPDKVKKPIYIGVTEKTRELYNSLENYTFAISVTEEEIIISATAGSFSAAVEYFAENYIGEHSGTSLPIELGTYVSQKSFEASTVSFDAAKEYTTAHTKEYDIPATGESRIMQGGGTDGKHMYFCMIKSVSDVNTEIQHGYVYKYDMMTGELVGMSERMDLGHGNDIAYNPYENRLYISNCMPNSSVLEVLNADTLERVGKVRLKMNVYAVDYEPTRRVYVLGVSGQQISILDESFNVSRDYIPSGISLPGNPSSNTTQGCCADENYIYYVQYKQNVIRVFDWSGNFVKEIALSIPATIEPENISVIGNRLFIGCNNSKWTGGELYYCYLKEIK